MNEWCCLVNLKLAIKAGLPIGTGRPFGVYMEGHDLGSAWFRDMHHQGFTDRYMDLSKYLIHKPGHRALFNQKLYKENELKASQIICKAFPKEYSELIKRFDQI